MERLTAHVDTASFLRFADTDQRLQALAAMKSLRDVYEDQLPRLAQALLGH